MQARIQSLFGVNRVMPLNTATEKLNLASFSTHLMVLFVELHQCQIKLGELQYSKSVIILIKATWKVIISYDERDYVHEYKR